MNQKNYFSGISLLTVFLLVFSNLFGQGDFCNSAVLIVQGVYNADGPSSGGGCHNCTPGGPGGIPAENADWYAFAPTSNGVISIGSCNGGADTRLWVYSGDCANLLQIASSDDACDIGNGEDWASEIENLPVFAGETYFFEWDDAWESTGFTFRLEFSDVTYDAAIELFAKEFFSIPDEQVVSYNSESFIEVFNNGSDRITGVEVNFKIFDLSQTASPFYEFTSPPEEIEAGSSDFLSIGIIPSLPPGDYRTEAVVTLNETDDRPLNNQSELTFNVSDITYVIDDDITVDGLGIDGPGTIWQGQNFKYYFDDQIVSVGMNILGGNAGDTLAIGVYETDPSSGRPTTPVHTSAPFVLETASPGWLQIALDSAIRVKADQTYFVGVFHNATGANLGLGYTDEIYLPNNCWISINGDPWANPESFDFQIAYQIRLQNGLSNHLVTFTVDISRETVSPEGVYLGYAIEGQALDSLRLEDAGNGLYSGSLVFPSLSKLQYLFMNGFPFISNAEQVPADCRAFYQTIPVRHFQVGFADVNLPKVCFGECSICPPPPCDDPDLLICDYFENYNPGNLDPQSDIWGVWDGIGGDGEVSNDRAFSGMQSMKILGTSNQGGTADVILDLGEYTDGRYSLEMRMYVPAGRQAYYNVQHDLNPHIWASDVYFEADGSGRIAVNSLDDFTFNYTQDDWVVVLQEFDLDRDSTWFWVDGNLAGSWKFSLGEDDNTDPVASLKWSGVIFYPANTNYLFYVDDVLFKKLPAAQVSATFKVDLSKFLNDGGVISGDGIKIERSDNPGNLLPMTDAGGGLWVYSGAVTVNQKLAYNFYNGDEKEPTDRLEDCGEADGSGGYQRVAQIGVSNFEADTVCFAYCLSCDKIIAVKEPGTLVGLNIFPNPTSGQITIRSKTHIEKVEVLDNLGRMIQTFIPDARDFSFDLSGAKGSRILKIVANDTIVYRKVMLSN